MADIEALMSKLRHPPSLPNWVRYNHRRVDDTAASMARFILGRPRHSLHKIYAIIADAVTFQNSDEVIYESLNKIRNPLVRKLGREILSVVIPYIRKNEIEGIEVFHDLEVLYRVGRGVSVPVKPTFVLYKDGQLTPVFVIGWTRVPFSDYQKRILSTLIDDALLRLEGFEGSDGLILCVPRAKGSKSEREIRSWNVSNYPPLLDHEKQELFDRYDKALDEVVPIVLEELARRGEI